MWNQIEQALNQSAASVVAGIARILPGTIAFIVSLLFATLLGWLLAWIVRRVLASLDFDRRMFSAGWSEYAGWAGTSTPSGVVARVVWWIVLLLGVLGGIAAFDPTLTSELALRIFGSAMNLLTAVVLLVMGNLLARFFARGALISLVNMNVPQARLFSLGVKWLVMILATAMALDHLSIGGRIVELAFGILFGGIVLALSLAVGLRSKDIAAWSLTRQSEERAHDETRPFDHL
jgi:hypothetical protein